MTQRTITRKADVQQVAELLCLHDAQGHENKFWQVLEMELLAHKVKFPLLEFVAETLFGCLSDEAQLKTINGLWGREAHGSSVVAGKLLQLQLSNAPSQAMTMAVEGIVKGDTWYHCDHLGERVFGHGLLTQFRTVLPLLRKYLAHENRWVRRAVGVAGHYATKKGLAAPQVQTTLALLLTEADSKDFQVQRGIGWGLKTIAKFHPQMMKAELATLPQGTISGPIMGKIRTGLKTAERTNPTSRLMPTFTEKQFKSILNKKKFIDSWFWDRYSINPYNGCLFGCVYCDARSAKYHMPEDFENQIVIKQGAAEQLDRRLSRARTLLPDVVGLGTVTDTYQGAEKVYENGRKILQVLAKHAYPAHIATKSTLVLRDAELLEQVGAESWCSVSVTVTTMQPDIAKFLDNRSPSPQRRLETIAQLKEQTDHVQVGLLLIPLVPFLTDSEADLEALFQAAKAAKADYLLFGGGMSMRDMQARWFLEKLEAHYPDLLPRYAQLYQFTPGSPTYDGLPGPPDSYTKPIYKTLLKLSERYELPWHMPRFIPQDFRRSNYLVAEKLLNEARLRQMNGRYWKDVYWAGQNIQNLSESLEDIAQRGELHTVRNAQGKIQEFVESFLQTYASAS